MPSHTIQSLLILIDLNQPSVVFDHISNGISITDKNTNIIYINPAFTRITGYTKAEAVGENPGILHSGLHDKLFYEDMWKQISENGFWEGEIWNRRKSGQIYPEYLTISKIGQNIDENFFYIAIFSDISFLKKDSKKTLHLAFYDPLTKLPNRNLYLDRINSIVKDLKSDESVVIFFMDLDRFKLVNDTYGHLVGDKLLRIVGERLAAMVRTGDMIARIGGDEFAAILTSVKDRNLVMHFADRLVEAIEKPFHIDGKMINVSISIGISFYPNDANNVEKILEDADRAMYTAKKSGKKIICYDTL